MPLDLLTSFRTAARECAHVMLESSSFIQREHASVEAAHTHQAAIKTICDAFTSNWFDIGTELDEMAELGLPNYSPTIRMRVDRIHNWLAEDLPTLHELVTALSSATEDDPQCGSAYILVAESATNVLHAFVAVSEARQRYLEAYEQEGGGSPFA
ncbi:MAG: hypothetical protein ACYCZR_06900 [Burkholderiales bacterium]